MVLREDGGAHPVGGRRQSSPAQLDFQHLPRYFRLLHAIYSYRIDLDEHSISSLLYFSCRV